MPKYKITYGIKNTSGKETKVIETDSLESAYEIANDNARELYDVHATEGTLPSFKSLLTNEDRNISEALDEYQQSVEKYVEYDVMLLK